MKTNWIIFLLLFSQIALAQEKSLTLAECIQYAFLHNLQSVKQEAQNEIYKIDQREAIGGFLPSVSAGTSIYMNFGRGVDPETNNYISNNTFSNAYEIYSSLVLFDGLSQVYRTKLSKINRLKGKEELQNIKDKMAFDVMEIFFNVLYYKGTAELAQQQLGESSNNLKKFQRMEELGLKSIPDLNEIQAKEAEDRFVLTKQINLYNLEIIKLKTKMNMPPEEDLQIAGYTDLLPVGKTQESAFAVYQQALSSLPKIQAAGKSLSATEMEYKIAKGRLFPTLSLGAGFSTGFSRMMDGSAYMSFSEQLKTKEGTYVNLSLSVPLFDRFSRSSEMKRSRQRLVIARSEHEETLRQAYSEIEQIVADVNGLSDEFRFAQKRTEAMQTAHQANLRKYEEGLISAIELTTSSNRLLNSRVEELYTNLKYQLKYRLLEYYRGN
ncbi:MAG: TolC family protein [Dysgonamonadaceae bacterium]|nr:TolC family protein [Dysgonamonadaceae bacterium]